MIVSVSVDLLEFQKKDTLKVIQVLLLIVAFECIRCSYM